VTSYIIRRALGLIPLFIGVIIISYVLLLMAPGGPAGSVIANPRMTQEMKAKWLDKWCLEDTKDPVAVARMFGGWSGVLNCERDGLDAFFSQDGVPNFLPTFLGGGDNGLLHGDLGSSLNTGRPVVDMIWERLPATLMLTMTALFIWVGTAIVLGTIAAVKRYSIYDQALTFMSYILYSLPTFWLGLMLIFAFGPALHLLPTGGVVNARDWPAFGSAQFWAAAGADPVNALLDMGTHLILPVVTLVAVNIAADSRFVRASMLETLSADFVRTARAKGLSAKRVIGRHAFRNAMLPVTTNIALEIPFLVSGAIVTETIFSWPGIGRLFIESVGERDYYVLMGLIIMTSFAILIANLLADVVYAIIDPRIRY
jgi:ABC-type dipeptide/oligopeptide/nickel transport system permease component